MDSVESCYLREFVIIAGAEDLYGRPGNKLMFLAQAVRYVRRWSKGFDLTTVFYFTGKDSKGVAIPTAAQVAAFKKSVTSYGGTPKAATAWSDVASHVNNTSHDGCKKYVQVMVFFAHGSPHRIWLSANNGVYFTSTEAAQINAASFLPKDPSRPAYGYRHVTSWACQTGNDGDTKTQEGALKNSLAQKVANYWNIEVRASVTKTSYTNTWAGGIAGRLNFGRREIDGGLWQDEGADGSVFSGEGFSQSPAPIAPGMYQLNPGQTSGYKTLSLD